MFLYDWYAGGFRRIIGLMVDLLESLDRYWALRITVQNVFQPLYQDHSLLGHLLGFIFRVVRIVLASLLYAAIGALFVIVYIGWASIPVSIIYTGFF